MGSSGLAAARRTIGLPRQSKLLATDDESNRHRHSQIPYCSRGRCGNPLADMAETRNRKKGIGDSYVSPCTFKGEKSDDSAAPMLSMKRHDVICDHYVACDDCDSKVIVCNIDSQAVRPVWPRTLPHSQG